MTSPVDLLAGELEITGRVMPASNATFVGTIGPASDPVTVVYKPITGEQPLWDFPDGDLASRELAAYLVSESTGWRVVPRTWLRDGPLGVGMVQLWCEPDPSQDAVDLVDQRAVPESGWRHVLDGLDGHDRRVSLIHEDSAALRRMAVFDVLVNNADRKGGHVLEMADGHRHGIDHGLTMHAEHKLRTVLWGWVGQPLDPDELVGVERVRTALSGDLGTALTALITGRELDALHRRCARLLEHATFPGPRGEMPAVPWPPF